MNALVPFHRPRRRPSPAGITTALALLAAAATSSCDRSPASGAAAGADTRPEPVRLLAAASLTNVLEALAPRLEHAAGTRIVLVFAASSTLARQLLAGADADLYLSADVDWVDELDAAGFVARRRPLPGNGLVVIVPAGHQADGPPTTDPLALLAGPALVRIAVADPSSVPAGRHARRALEHAGAWSAVEGRIVVAGSVRQALAWVETGEADAGIVYATDAAISSHVRVAGELAPDPRQPVRGAAALTVVGAGRPAARRTWDALAGEDARAAFARAGFDVTLTEAVDPNPAPALPDGRR